MKSMQIVLHWHKRFNQLGMGNPGKRPKTFGSEWVSILKRSLH